MDFRTISSNRINLSTHFFNRCFPCIFTSFYQTSLTAFFTFNSFVIVTISLFNSSVRLALTSFALHRLAPFQFWYFRMVYIHSNAFLKNKLWRLDVVVKCRVSEHKWNGVNLVDDESKRPISKKPSGLKWPTTKTRVQKNASFYTESEFLLNFDVHIYTQCLVMRELKYYHLLAWTVYNTE